MGDGLRRAREAARQTRVARLPRVGDVFADNDPRSEGRTLRVERIEGDRAVCVVLTNPTSFTGSSWQRDTRGKTTRISLSRFKPTSTGYRLVSEAGQ